MLRKVSVLLSSLFIFFLFSCSNLFINNSASNETKLTVKLPSAGIARAAETSRSYFYKVTCIPEVDNGTKLEKTGKSGEEITFSTVMVGTYTVVAEAFQNEKMELLLYKGESKAEVVADKDTRVTIVLKYVGPKTQVSADGSENTIKINFNENTGELSVETQTKDGVTLEKVYWLYNGELIDDSELQYVEKSTKIKLSAIAKFSDGTYSATTVEESLYNGTSEVSFSKQSLIKENTDATEKGIFNYSIKVLPEGFSFYSKVKFYPVDSLLAADAKIVFESDIDESTQHSYTGKLDSGWYYLIAEINLGGSPAYFNQMVRVEKGFESDYGFTLVVDVTGGDVEPDPDPDPSGEPSGEPTGGSGDPEPAGIQLSFTPNTTDGYGFYHNLLDSVEIDVKQTGNTVRKYLIDFMNENPDYKVYIANYEVNSSGMS